MAIDGGCGNPKCCASTGIHAGEGVLDGMTFGQGKLDYNGYWKRPCYKCARAFEKLYPEAKPCWPFEEEQNVPR